MSNTQRIKYLFNFSPSFHQYQIGSYSILLLQFHRFKYKIKNPYYMLAIIISYLSFLITAINASQCAILDSNAYGITSGLMQLLPNDLNSGVTNKDFYQSFSQANFPSNGLITYAFSLSGFSGPGIQSYYSLNILIVEIQNSNTRFRLVLDFRQPNSNFLSSWSQIDISYLLVTQNMEGNGISYIWAYSQQITVSTSSLKKGIVNGQLFNHPNNNNMCGFDGLYWHSDGCLQKNAKVLYHVYIMGFQFNTQNYTGKYQLAYQVLLQKSGPSGGYSADEQQSALNVVYGSSISAGPILSINGFSGQLQTIQIALVMSVAEVLTPNYPIGTFSLTYSGIYFRNNSNPYLSTNLFQVQSNVPAGNNLYFYVFPNIRYVIYGLSRFVANKSSPRSPVISVGTSLISQGIISYEETMMMVSTDIVFSADFYYKRLDTICGTQIGAQSQIQIVDMQNITFSTIPTDKQNLLISNVQNGDISTSSNQLAIQFDILADTKQAGIFKSWTNVLYNYIVPDNPYQFQLSFNQIGNDGFIDGDSYAAIVTVNGNQIYANTLLGTPAYDVDTNIKRGLNIQNTTIQIQLYVVANRSAILDIHFRFSILILQFQLVFDPVSQCCVQQCPENSGLNVLVTPISCISCDVQKGLFFDVNSEDCQCISGYYYEPNILRKCFQCQTQYCKICNSDQPQKCVECVTYANLDETFKTCSCSQGFYPSNGQCLSCNPKCLSCSSSFSCDSCLDINHRDSTNNCSCIKTYYDTGATYCSACNPSCATCNDSISCLSCNSSAFRVLSGTVCKCLNGYFQLIDSNQTRSCAKCDDTCLTCSISSTSCIECPTQKNRERVLIPNQIGAYKCLCLSGYHEVQNGVCVQSDCTKDINCAQCYSQLKQCTQCITGRNRVLQTPQGICVCQIGYFQNSNGTCQLCQSGCADCQNLTHCNSCVFLASKNDKGGCSCPISTFFSLLQGVGFCSNCILNCQSCQDSTTCQVCSKNFTLNMDRTCSCSQSRFIDKNEYCQRCSSFCLACLNQTYCTKCVVPLVSDSGICASTCRVGYYSSQYICLPCPTGCLSCITFSLCSLCQKTYFIFNGICYQNCPPGTVQNVDSYVCVPCNNPCKTCSSHPSQCTSCQFGQGYLQNYNQTQVCVQQCSPGTFSNNGVCRICDFNCDTCLSTAKNCISCPKDQFLFSGSCFTYCPGILYNNICVNQCPDGFYNISNSACAQCNKQCLTCNSNNLCLTCINGLFSNNGTCVQTCDLGWYSFKGYCVSCSSSCLSCQNNPMNCTSCHIGFNLTLNRCYLTCKVNQYFDLSTNLCVSCSGQCKTCKNSNVCLTCLNQQLPTNGKCIICSYPCQICVQNSTTLCSTCLSGFYLFNFECVAFCPKGTSLINQLTCQCDSNIIFNGQCVNSCPLSYARIGFSCQKCMIFNCNNCSINIQQCQQCNAGYTLNILKNNCQVSIQNECVIGQTINSQNKCQSICPNYYNYLNGNNNGSNQEMCIYGSCPIGYYSNGFGSCIQSINIDQNQSLKFTINQNLCKTPYFLQNQTCLISCNPGYFSDIQSRTCLTCSQNCTICTSYTQCQLCKQGFIIMNGLCQIINCQNGWYLYNSASCVQNCPLGTFGFNNICMRICPTNTYYFGMVCYIQCPTLSPYQTNDACVSSCQNGVNDSIKLICNN